MEYQTFTTAEEVYEDYRNRREGLLKALTVDVDRFYAQCDPERENLCLYGYADRTWEVNLPAEEVPPEIPEPALGINFARDGMQKNDWLQLVAMHSDTWLLSVAFFNGARLDAAQRTELFNMINGNPTLYEIISGRARANSKPKPQKVQQPAPPAPMPQSAPQSAPKPKRPEVRPSSATKRNPKPTRSDYSGDPQMDDSDGEYDDGDGDPCPSCGGYYKKDEFWIACDVCETWWHGKCVKMSPQIAERTKTWKCPSCVKRMRTN
uniref:Phd finger protein alfin-like 5-like n=1 Tax=Tetraselmis sp. GSL018 TaxID=582737 RepID=A0A061RAF4_9CHLO|mmetsp:Transcript_20082/g.47827  ORF Transcript_20082/g.47827 Transcript_20082/m.47827 type:complete len:264 (+) Transcript_20082:262-1053(+)